MMTRQVHDNDRQHADSKSQDFHAVSSIKSTEMDTLLIERPQ